MEVEEHDREQRKTKFRGLIVATEEVAEVIRKSEAVLARDRAVIDRAVQRARNRGIGKLPSASDELSDLVLRAEAPLPHEVAAAKRELPLAKERLKTLKELGES